MSLPDDPTRLPDEDELEWVRAELAALPRPTMPPELSARISAALAAEASANVRQLPTRRRPVLGWVGAAAALVVLAGVGINLFRPSSSTPAQVNVANPTSSSVISSPELQAVSLQVSDELAHANPSASSAPHTSVPIVPSGSSATQLLDLSTALFVPGTFAATAEGLADCLKGLGLVASPMLTERVRLGSVDAVAIVMGVSGQQPILYVVGIHCSGAASELLARAPLATASPTGSASGSPSAS